MQKHNQYNINFDGYRFYPNVFLINSEVGGSVHNGAKLGDMFSEAKLCGVCKTITTHTAELIPMSAAISGPINRRWGYLFGGAPDARTLAHELQACSVRPSFQESSILNWDELKADGRTNPDERSDIGRRLTLRHTFSSELCGGNPGHTANQNLMDYGFGTGLNRFQWEAIHNPAIIGKMFQSDEDGALRGRNDYEKALLVIEAIRCAYVRPSTTGIQFERDTKLKFVEPVLTDNFTGLADGVKYEKIRIYLKDDNVTNLPQTVTFVNEGDMSSFDMGNLIVKVNTSQVSQLAKYLQPTQQEFKIQVNDFINAIKIKYDENNSTSRGIIIGILRVSSQCMYEEFIKEQRIALLHRMRNDKSSLALPDEVARIVIDLIRTTPHEDAKFVLDYLSTSGLLEYYDKSILDFGTNKKYYTRFIKELLILYNAAYSDRLTNCFTSDQWGNVFVKVTVEKQTFGSFEFIDKNTTPFYQWSKNCEVPTWRYTNKKIDIQNNITCGYYNNAKQYIDPLEAVVVYFEEGLYLDFFEIPTDFDQRVVTVPAFVLSWFRSKAQASNAIDFVSDALTIYASCLSFGQGALISKGVPKVLLAAWSYIYKLDAAMQLILTNDEIKNQIRGVGAEGNKEGETFLDTYNLISGFIDYLGQPGLEFLINKNIPDLLSHYVALNGAWEVVKTSPLSSLTEQQKSEISSNLLIIKQKLNDETIIEG